MDSFVSLAALEKFVSAFVVVVILFVFFCGAGDGVQCLTHARPASPAPRMF